MIEFLKYIEAHMAIFWAVPALCFVVAVALYIAHKRRTMPLYEIGPDNVMRRAKVPDEAWRRK